jgi:2-oxo-4-hydroxy-4-carboxy-5-ureidoimidazoline decarboxylase
MIGLDDVNAMDRDAFREAFGGVFEHSPWVADVAWSSRPFSSLDDLHAAMAAAVRAAAPEDRLALLHAHPELAGEAMRRRLLTAASTGEQAGAGLDALGREEADRFDTLNRAYRERFGFPFIIAVKDHTRDGILADFARRLGNDPGTELETAIAQVMRIARLRLEALVRP